MKLIIVTSIPEISGEDYINFLGYPRMNVSEVYDPRTLEVDYGSIKNQFFKNKKFVLVGYPFEIDPRLYLLKKMCDYDTYLFKTEVHYLYTDLDKLYKGQKGLSESEYILWCKGLIRNDLDFIYYLQKSKVVDKFEYIYQKDIGFVPSSYGEIINIVDICMNVKELLAFVDEVSGDPLYQTIELDGEVIREGTAECWNTWDNIKNLIEWKDKSVCDLGCFNGYFSFKVEEAGAKEVIGLDENDKAVEVASVIGRTKESKCKFYKKIAGRDSVLFDKVFDVILVLNVLEYIVETKGIKACENVIKEIFSNCKEVIFELSVEQENMIFVLGEQYNFKLAHQLSSHRKSDKGEQKTIMYLRKV